MLGCEREQERHYGDLQGKNKKETAQKYGDEQVHIWRRSYDTPPASVHLHEPPSSHLHLSIQVLTCALILFVWLNVPPKFVVYSISLLAVILSSLR